MLQLATEESAELLLVLNGVASDLARCPPGVQRIQERISPRPQPPRPPSESESHHAPSREPESPPEYTLTDKDREFCSALNELRRDRTQTLFGLAVLNNLGPYLIMADPVLDRIAECARAQKLSTLDDLYRETAEWYWEALELGEQVLELASRYYPRSAELEGVPRAQADKNTTTL